MIPKTILIVDDEQTTGDLCWHALTNEGYDVKYVASGEEALNLASSEQFHLVLIDMSTPGIDGLEAFQALKKTQDELIGVLITDQGTMDTAIQAMKLGFNGFIRKPFTTSELVQVVNDSLHKAGLMEENTRLKTLIPLYSIGEKFLRSQTKKEILDKLIKEVSRQTGAQRISVMLYDKTEACLRIAAAIGIKEEIVHRIRIEPGERIAGSVFQTGEPIILTGGPEDNPRFASLLRHKDITTAISFPMKATYETLGVLNVSKVGKGSAFGQADLEMLSIICGQAVMALENVRVLDERKEKIRMRTLFEQYVAPEVAEGLISDGPNLFEVGEIKHITVLFADIRNFTLLVQHLPLETLRSFLNDFSELLTETIFTFKGTLDKFIGNALLAIFGAPIPLGEPYNAAASTAIEILRRFTELKEIWTFTKQPFDQIGLGIGITSGEMFLGNVGSQKRLDYTVIGTDANLARQLSSDAALGQILITENVKDHLGSQFHVHKKSRRLSKGLDKPISIYSISTEPEH